MDVGYCEVLASINATVESGDQDGLNERTGAFPNALKLHSNSDRIRHCVRGCGGRVDAREAAAASSVLAGEGTELVTEQVTLLGLQG